MKTKLLTMGLGLLAGLAVAEETHVVEPGETLWSISRSHGVSVGRLRAENGLQGNLIVVGARLVVPGEARAEAVTHTVAKGETLFRIGRRYGVSVGSLQEWNGLARPEDLRAGSVLKLGGPGGGSGEICSAPPEDPVTPPLPEDDRTSDEILDDILEPVRLEKNMRFGDVAARHGMTVEQLNALNGWSFLKDDQLGAGTQVYVKN